MPDRGKRAKVGGEFARRLLLRADVLKGHNKMRVFQEEIFGPVLGGHHVQEMKPMPLRSPTTPSTVSVPGSWTRNGNLAYRMGRAIKAGRVWTNCYHLYPAGAAVWGLQDLRYWSGEPSDDAGALLPNQEPPCQLQHETPWFLLEARAMWASDWNGSELWPPRRHSEPLPRLWSTVGS